MTISIMCMPAVDERVFVVSAPDGSCVTVTIGYVSFIIRDGATADRLRDAFDRASHLLRGEAQTRDGEESP